MKHILIFLLFTLIFTNQLHAQVSKNQFFIGSSAFTLVNLDTTMEFPPNFYQLNLGYTLTEKDVISIELITWKYYAPLGIPYGESFDKESEQYPGSISSLGAGFAYQRFLWKGFYTAVHATFLKQTYKGLQGGGIGKGSQLFTAFRLGYHYTLWSDKIFIEPSFAITHWPINTGLPASFESIENKWNNYFLFEPGLHIGYMF
jgi:hypothetical protein